MRIFNEDKTIELNENELDFESGHLINDVLITHIPEQQAVEEQSHYEVVAEYSNGGKDVELVIDVAGQPYIEEHDETEDILVYVLYTDKELQDIVDDKRKAEIQIRLDQLSNDIVQDMAGEVVPDIDERKEEFVELHNELRVLLGKQPRKQKVTTLV